MTGKFIGLTGPTACGKDVVASHLERRLARANIEASCVSGGMFYRAAAIWASEHGHGSPLPPDTFKDTQMFLDNNTAHVVHSSGERVYTEQDCQAPEVAVIASRFDAVPLKANRTKRLPDD